MCSYNKYSYKKVSRQKDIRHTKTWMSSNERVA